MNPTVLWRTAPAPSADLDSRSILTVILAGDGRWRQARKPPISAPGQPHSQPLPTEALAPRNCWPA